MKQITSILLAGSAAIFMTACGGGGSSTDYIPPATTTPTPTPPPSDIIGSGTTEDPYIVGSGEFSFNDTKYFEILSDKTDCNVITYNINNLSPWNQTDAFDDTFESLSSEGGYIYNLPTVGTYSVKAYANDTEEATLGIYSSCIDQPNDNYELENVSVNATNTFPLDIYSKLYKFSIDTDSNVTVRTLANTDYVYYYDSNLSNIFTTYKDEAIELKSGAYYVLVKQFGYNSQETPEFYFSVE